MLGLETTALADGQQHLGLELVVVLVARRQDQLEGVRLGLRNVFRGQRGVHPDAVLLVDALGCVGDARLARDEVEVGLLVLVVELLE